MTNKQDNIETANESLCIDDFLMILGKTTTAMQVCALVEFIDKCFEQDQRVIKDHDWRTITNAIHEKSEYLSTKKALK